MFVRQFINSGNWAFPFLGATTPSKQGSLKIYLLIYASASNKPVITANSGDQPTPGPPEAGPRLKNYYKLQIVY